MAKRFCTNTTFDSIAKQKRWQRHCHCQRSSELWMRNNNFDTIANCITYSHIHTHHTHRVCSRPFSFSSASIGVCPLLSLLESVGWDNGRDLLLMLHITEKCKIITRKTNILLASCSDMFMFGVCVCVQWIKKLHFPLYSRQRLPHYTIIVLFAVNAICLVYRYSSPFLVLLLPCYTDGFA